MERSKEEIFGEVLGLPPEWEVTSVRTEKVEKKIYIRIRSKLAFYQCPVCGKTVKRYDTRLRRLLDLRIGLYKTILEVEVPRVKCEEHRVQQLQVNFADKYAVYTDNFASMVIERLQERPALQVAKELGVSWDMVDNIKQAAIKRGLWRREMVKVKHLGIDETSYQKGHDYIGVIMDKDHDKVLAVLDGRTAETVKAWLLGQKAADLSELESISMDLSGPFLKAVQEVYPDKWERLVCYDRFHVSQLLNKALDAVRKREWTQLNEAGKENPLKKMRYGYLINSGRTDNRTAWRRKFIKVSKMNLITSRAWRIKEMASTLWDYEYLGAAKKNWKALFWWMSHCRIPEMLKAYRTLKQHFFGILNAIRLKVTNAILESTNSCIQKVKRAACGFRNKQRFMDEVMFHFGKLELQPIPLK
jgi:transposase